MALSQEDKQTLHQIAREAIFAALQGQPPPPLPLTSSTLQERRGAFVSLHWRGQLRGCIGLIQPVKPLAQAIQDMALAAAFRDPRFPPLTPEEFSEVDIEISVLSPLHQIEKIEEIEVGKHGLYINRGPCAGLLLPQVATQCRWDAETFLRETCRKAGLPLDAWREKDTQIYIFSAEIF
ncbi:MAG: AmmeMemoRadiSam system protein A [Desulfobacteraceae bacterium]